MASGFDTWVGNAPLVTDTITNPDKIGIGDQIIIPTPSPGSGGASTAPSASVSP